MDGDTCRRLDFIEPNKEKEPASEEKLTNERHLNILEEKTPKVGMEFDTEDAAYNFYNEYAKVVGFSIRIMSGHTHISGRTLDRIFCCSCQGYRLADKRDVNVKSHRPETRTGCKALMKINGRNTVKYIVTDFVPEHNGHVPASPNKTFLLRSHRNIKTLLASQVDTIESSGIAPKSGYTLMAKQMGGRENVGFLLEDYRNYLRSKRTVQTRGETGGVLEYLKQRQLNDPNFFYAIQLDEDDLIANILWIDGQMKVDYIYFGDVVSFDSTYRKNKESRHFSLFVGVNHHKQTVVFGAALLYDETASTFSWLFGTFAEAMSGKKPKTILTDQDPAMANAIVAQWPETCHRLCIWHIYQNAATNLSQVFANFTSFSKDFSSCIYDYDEEDDFLNAWHHMLERYGLQTNKWLARLFKIREKWALVYGRQSFCADMITTQRSESMNSVLKRYVSYKHDLLRFFHHFDRLVDDRRFKEYEADFKVSQSTPVVSFPIQILKHAATIYTYNVFKLFQEQASKAYDCKVDMCSMTDEIFQYKVVTLGKKYQHTVVFHRSRVEVSCSCRKFEFAGILCSHALKVLSLNNVVEIPDLYIMKRWTKKAKKNIVEDQSTMASVGQFEPSNEDEQKELKAARNKELGNLHNQLAMRANLSTQTYQSVKNCLIRMIEDIDASFESATLGKPTPRSKFIDGVGEKTSNHDGQGSTGLMVKGLKTKEKNPIKTGKRPRGGLEKRPRQRKLSNTRQNENNVQAYQVSVNSLTNTYPTEGSSFSLGEPYQFINVVNPTANQQSNFAQYSNRDQRSGMSLTNLFQAQEHLIQPRGFNGEHYDLTS